MPVTPVVPAKKTFSYTSLTPAVWPYSKSTKPFEWPPIDKIANYKAKGIYLAGFQSDNAKGDSAVFNFVMSNGDSSSTMKGSATTKNKIMIPDVVLKTMRGVTIEYSTSSFYDYIIGFTFIDKDGSKIFKIGGLTTNTSIDRRSETVKFGEGEIIVGVKAKLYPTGQSKYTDF